jgi:hypothetical protein
MKNSAGGLKEVMHKATLQRALGGKVANEINRIRIFRQCMKLRLQSGVRIYTRGDIIVIRVGKGVRSGPLSCIVKRDHFHLDDCPKSKLMKEIIYPVNRSACALLRNHPFLENV